MNAFEATTRGLLIQLPRKILTAGAFAGFYLGGAILSWIVLPLLDRRGRSREERARHSQAVVRRSFYLFHDYMRVLRLLHFNPREVDLQLPEGPCVIVANHPTLVDVTALLAAAGPMCTVVKPELTASFAFGGLLHRCWHIVTRSDDPIGAAKVVEEALARLDAGLRVLVFPEGSRSPEGGVRRFRRGAFEIARRAGVPVVPLFLACNPPMLSKTAPWHRTPETTPRLTTTRLPTLDPSRWANAAAMAADLRAGYVRILEGGEFGLLAPVTSDPLAHRPIAEAPATIDSPGPT